MAHTRLTFYRPPRQFIKIDGFLLCFYVFQSFSKKNYFKRILWRVLGLCHCCSLLHILSLLLCSAVKWMAGCCLVTKSKSLLWLFISFFSPVIDAFLLLLILLFVPSPYSVTLFQLIYFCDFSLIFFFLLLLFVFVTMLTLRFFFVCCKHSNRQ